MTRKWHVPKQGTVGGLTATALCGRPMRLDTGDAAQLERQATATLYAGLSKLWCKRCMTELRLLVERRGTK